MTTPGGLMDYPITLRGVVEDIPGPRWKALFDTAWPAYRSWYLSAPGDTDLPDVRTGARMLARHMPELMPTYLRLLDLVEHQPDAARMLSLWNPPRYAPGCSQVALPGPVLCRNYDYAPDLFEGVVFTSAFTGRRVLGTSDCLWGLLDGMNDAGLAVSLAFGGRPGSGQGFGVPLVVRYLLEVATSTRHACDLLARMPVAMSYNLTMIDATGVAATAFVAPDSPPEITATPLATNHRGEVPEYPDAARALHSVERRAVLHRLAALPTDPDGLAAAFLTPPLHRTSYARGFGTLYTALYRPALGVVDYHWPGTSWRRGFADPDATLSVTLHEGERALIR